MSKHKLRIFGPRAALVEVADNLEGSIELPQTRAKVFSLGVITHLGDGKIYIPGKKFGTYVPDVEEFHVAVGDTVMFQLPPMMAANMTYKLDDTGYLFLSQSDIIARLKSNVVSIENFEIVGRYVLCSRTRASRTSSGIILPDIVEDYNDDMNHFEVVQKGCLVDRCEVGDSVVVDRTRANPVSLSGSTFYFIDEFAVHGVIC